MCVISTFCIVQIRLASYEFVNLILGDILAIAIPFNGKLHSCADKCPFCRNFVNVKASVGKFLCASIK